MMNFWSASVYCNFPDNITEQNVFVLTVFWFVFSRNEGKYRLKNSEHTLFMERIFFQKTELCVNFCDFF